jgi:predicted  nucleic acid-binding Zn-ribbon protein
MIDDLENLISLQKTDLEIGAIESRLKKIPREIADLEQEIATERANAESAQDKLDESQKARRTFEGELELLESKIEKYKDQLMQVKTNEEYKAMQKQVESAKVEVSDKEDKILFKMEEAEQLQEELSHRHKELDEGLVRVKKMEDELETEAALLRQELAGKKSRREQILDSMPKDLIIQYDEIGRVRGGIAIAQAKDEHCEVCHVRLRPQVYSELRVGNKILRCENCSRILYYLEPASP